MESLVLVVAIMVYTCVLSGPITIALSSQRFQSWTSHLALKALRRTFMAILNFLGLTISGFFISGPVPAAVKVVAIISMALNIWAIDREYGGTLTEQVKKKLGKRFRRGNQNGPAGQS